MKKPELLLPAGSLVKLKTALLYGADAVYAGTPDMSLRTQSAFTADELEEGIRAVHDVGKKIYLTLNLYAHDEDARKLPQFVETLRALKPDGVLVADPGIFWYLKENAPELNRFVSTQANICSAQAVHFWQEMGAKLCVLGREVTFAEMKEIRRQCPNMMLETFIHGAMCMSYSGRCLISNFLADRSANKGKCAQCCRWHYKLKLRLKDGTLKDFELTEQNKDAFEFLLEEDFRPGELFEVMEDTHGSYILNSRDLCLMPRLDEILSIGMDSLKIEGRNKTEYYAAITARAYRHAIDAYFQDPHSWRPDPYMAELNTLQNRGYCLGFHEGKLTPLGQNYDYTRSQGDWLFAGSVVGFDGDDALFELRNCLSSGDVLEFVLPDSKISLKLDAFEDAHTGEITQRVSAGQHKTIRLHLREVPKYTVARVERRITAHLE